MKQLQLVERESPGNKQERGNILHKTPTITMPPSTMYKLFTRHEPIGKPALGIFMGYLLGNSTLTLVVVDGCSVTSYTLPTTLSLSAHHFAQPTATIRVHGQWVHL